MTIGEKNKLNFAIGHPRLVGGNFIAMNLRNFNTKTENNVRFVEYPRNPDEQSYYQGAATLAIDMLRVEKNFEPTAKIKTQGEGATPALSDDIVLNELDAEISGNDREELIFEDAGYDDFIHFGATKIKEGSETVRNDTTSTSLVRGDDYELDPDRGMIALKPSAGDLTDDYSIGYIFKNTARNLALTLDKLPEMGGQAILVFDQDDYTGGAGFTYNVSVEASRVDLNPDEPQEAEVSFDIRRAVTIDDIDLSSL